jgi:hypothetical protein
VEEGTGEAVLDTAPELLIARTPEQHRANGIDVRIHHEVTAVDGRVTAVVVFLVVS